MTNPSEHDLLIDGVMVNENGGRDIRGEMKRVLDAADPDASIVLIVEGLGYPAGSYVMLRSDELRPGIARAAWVGLQEVLHTH